MLLLVFDAGLARAVFVLALRAFEEAGRVFVALRGLVLVAIWSPQRIDVLGGLQHTQH
jgi:hypothetical protein